LALPLGPPTRLPYVLYSLFPFDSWVAMIKPLSRLNQSLNSPVIVELRSGREYRGVLDGFDPHMNLVLRNAEEVLNKETQRKMDVAIVRGDNVIYISP
jgi:small nuclear ribonucleoprotein